MSEENRKVMSKGRSLQNNQDSTINLDRKAAYRLAGAAIMRANFTHNLEKIILSISSTQKN